MITVHTRHTSVCMAPRLWLSRQENCPWSSGKAKDLKLQCLGFELQNWHKMFVPWREHLHITPELLHEYWFVLFVNKSNQHSIGQIGNIQLIMMGKEDPRFVWIEPLVHRRSAERPSHMKILSRPGLIKHT